MTGSAPLRQARQDATQPGDESQAQDSQAVLARVIHEMGMSEESPCTEHVRTDLLADNADIALNGSQRPSESVSQASRSQHPQGHGKKKHPGLTTSPPPTAVDENQGAPASTWSNLSASDRRRPSQPRIAALGSSSASDAARQPRRSSKHASRPVTRKPSQEPAPAGANASLPKMDTSQQSPTQVNEDRDYGLLPDVLPAGLSGADSQHTQDKTLHEDDTGAVNFNHMSQFARPSSQVSEDVGFEETRGDWRIADETPRHSSSHGRAGRLHAAPPETPALPKNPFGVRPNIGVPLAGTQLFGQTQMSSARKHLSPTSSRPSPNLLHNTVSTCILETSPLKDRVNVSSPTDLQTSSPRRPLEPPSTVLRETPVRLEGLETPSLVKPLDDALVAESPTRRPPRSSGSYYPKTYYEPMEKSQERKMLKEPSSLQQPESDDDANDTVRLMERRRRAQKKREQARAEMGRVSFTPPRPHALEGTDTRKRRRRFKEDTDGQESVARPGRDGFETPRPSSVELASKTQTTSTDTTNAGPLVTATPVQDEAVMGSIEQPRTSLVHTATREKLGDDEIIPATSPVQSSPTVTPADDESTASEPDLPDLTLVASEPQSNRDETAEPSSLPRMRRRPQRAYSKRLRNMQSSPFVESKLPEAPPTKAQSQRASPLPPSSAPSNGLAQETPQSSSSAMAHGEIKERTPSSKEGKTASPDDAVLVINDATGNVSSDLTSPPSTTSDSVTSTPGTQALSSSQKAESPSANSSRRGMSLRKQALRSAAAPESPQSSAHAHKARRSTRLDSESTDELQWCPSVSALERSTYQPAIKRLAKNSLAHGASGIFEGMVFAISLHSGRSKQQDKARRDLEDKITHAGGIILQAGFQQIFEDSTLLRSTEKCTVAAGEFLKPLKSSPHRGFTALIADGHSRRPKYMQALALGLPCLAQQWITACLSKETILNWEPYLLCAGTSAVLGNATRSRNIATYPADSARLAHVITHRRKLLEGQTVLVVVNSKKARIDAKEPYIFLAGALGPSLTRVFNAEQAKDTLQESERAGRPFDWLYVDEGTCTAEDVLSSTERGTRKRKRASLTPGRSIRVLNDELVIQSLILGRMVEEDEMTF